MGAARRLEALAPPDRQLLKRLQAVGGKTGREDRHFGFAFARQTLQLLVGRGAKPFGWPEAGLEGDGQRPAERVGQ